MFCNINRSRKYCFKYWCWNYFGGPLRQRADSTQSQTSGISAPPASIYVCRKRSHKHVAFCLKFQKQDAANRVSRRLRAAHRMAAAALWRLQARGRCVAMETAGGPPWKHWSSGDLNQSSLSEPSERWCHDQLNYLKPSSPPAWDASERSSRPSAGVTGAGTCADWDDWGASEWASFYCDVA